jgi:hypothetical protein
VPIALVAGEPKDFQLAFSAPVPVGHAVELREVQQALFDHDGSLIGYQPVEQPLVRHVESGIVYCIPALALWVQPKEVVLVPPGGGFRSHGPLVRARVVACVVGGGRGQDTTRLVLEPAPPETPFR